MSKKFNIKHTPEFKDFYTRLMNIALSVFEWEGLPASCNARFLEWCLYNYGHAIFVNDDERGYLNLQVAPAGELNVYHEPVYFTAYSIGYSKIYDMADCVYIRNNLTNIPTELTIIKYAERLAKIQRAIDVNVNAQKTPITLCCDEKTKTSLQILYNHYEGDTPAIFGSKSLLDKPITALTTGAPYVADKLQEQKRIVWNECLEFLGLNTNPADKKKERLIISEVDANNEQIEMQLNTMLLTRQNACKELKEKFGLDVSVKIRLEEPEKIIESEV